MSYESLEDKDLELKNRMMNLLWNLGWFARPNVKLQRYQEGKRTTGLHTDIDVLAVRLLPLQNPITAVCSAKSGKESDSEQIFWLAGVRSYFGANSAYYVRTHASLRDAKTLCQKLDIISLNDEQLQIMEQRLSLNPSSYPFDLEFYGRVHGFMEELKKAKVGLYNYISEKYWIDPFNNQLLRIVTAIHDVSQLTLTHECSIFVKYYLSTLLALPLQRMGHLLLTTPQNLLKTELETALMGGELARLDKERTFQIVEKALADSKKTIDLNAQLRKLADELYDVVLSMIDHYEQSVYIPRFLDALTHQLAKGLEATPRVEKVALPDLSQNDWKYAAKLARDVLLFMERIGGMAKSEIAA
jgi:hypothetical protein